MSAPAPNDRRRRRIANLRLRAVALVEEGDCLGARVELLKAADPGDVQKAVWSAAMVNGFPDSSFAFISPGGEKDAEGKTVPRSLRHLPYKDASGKPDAAHVRNALARLAQTDIPAAAKATARRRLVAAARQLKIEVAESAQKSAHLDLASHVAARTEEDKLDRLTWGVRDVARTIVEGETEPDEKRRLLAQLARDAVVELRDIFASMVAATGEGAAGEQGEYDEDADGAEMMAARAAAKEAGMSAKPGDMAPEDLKKALDDANARVAAAEAEVAKLRAAAPPDPLAGVPDAARETVKKLNDQLAEMQARFETGEAISKARQDFPDGVPGTTHETVGPLLLRVAKGRTTAEDATEIARLLKVGAELARVAHVGKAIGFAGEPVESDGPMGESLQKARAARAANPALRSDAEALDYVWREDPELAARVRALASQNRGN